MRRIIIILPLLLLLLAGCHSADEAPDYVVPQDSMVAFLTEAHIVESYYLIRSNQQMHTVDDKLQASYDTLFLRHGLTRQRLDTSMLYYNAHPAQLKAIYQQVESNLRCLESSH